MSRWDLHTLTGPPAHPADVERWPSILATLKNRPFANRRERVRWELSVDIYLGRLAPQYINGALVLDVRYLHSPSEYPADPDAVRYWSALLLRGRAVMLTPDGPHRDCVPFTLADVQEAAGVALALAHPLALREVG